MLHQIKTNMKTLTTISNREFKVSSNKSARKFTIRTSFATYRTTKMTKEEFTSALNWSGQDWAEFLKTDDYYKIK